MGISGEKPDNWNTAPKVRYSRKIMESGILEQWFLKALELSK